MLPLDSTLKSTLAELSFIVTLPPSNSTAPATFSVPLQTRLLIPVANTSLTNVPLLYIKAWEPCTTAVPVPVFPVVATVSVWLPAVLLNTM